MAKLASQRPVSGQAPAPEAPVLRAPRPRYMPYGDAARVLGTIVVVTGHVCDMKLFGNTDATMSEWWVCNFVDAATRWAVPIYVMLSGSLLLDPDRSETPSQFYKKRLARLGVPIVIWSAFYMWLGWKLEWFSAGQTWINLIEGKPYVHLHFIFRIAGLYAFTPMIRVFLRHAERKMVVAVTMICLGLSAADSVMNAFTGSEASMFLRFVPFLGYYLLGYLLRDKRLSKRSLLGCWMLAIACVMILAGGTGLLASLYGRNPYPSPGFLLYDFLSPVRVAYAVAAWLIIVNTFHEGWLHSRLGRFTSKHLAPATLGIYLAHLMFREILHVNGITATWPNVWIGIPLLTVLIYIPTTVLVLVIMRLPVIRKIVI